MSIGIKYNEVADNSAVTIAKAIRADIAKAKKAGLLPLSWKYSVRSEYYSMGQSIDITVNSFREAWILEDLEKCDCYQRSAGNFYHGISCAGAGGLSATGVAVRDLLQSFHDAYNHNNSNSQIDYFDVRYYGQVRID